MTPTFITARLRVFRANYVPDPDAGDIYSEPHTLFFAVDRTASNCAPCCTATVRRRDGWIEFAWTHPGRRRQGLMRELWVGIEQHLGRKLWSTGCTGAGQKLVDAMELAR